MEIGVFLTHKVVPGTFPSLLKVALGKQSIYLLLRIGITRNLSLKNSKFPLFFGILCQFSSVYMDILLVKPLWPMYNKVKANIGLNYHLRVVNNFYTHLVTKHAS